MKIAKKVLSVILAVAMILSTVAVASSALYGDASTSKYQAKFTLSAQKVTYTFNSKSGACGTVTEVDTTAKSGTIEVEAGDKYRIGFTASTNYNVGYVQVGIYYSQELLEPNEQAQAAVKKNCSAGTLKNLIYSNFTANQWMASCVTESGSTDITLGSSMLADQKKEKFYDTVQKEDGTAYFSETGVDDYSLIKFMSSPYIPSAEEPGYTQMLGDADDDASWENGLVSTTPLFYFTLQIPSDAQPGDTYKVFIPVEERQDADSGYMFMGYTADDENDTVVADDLTNKAQCILGDDQYFDLSGAVLTFTIPKGEEELDRSELETTYNTYKDYVLDNYKDGDAKTNFITALNAAADELTNEAETTQEAIDLIKTNLIEKAALLELKSADKEALQTLYNECVALSADDYKEDNWSTFQDMIVAAKAVLDNDELTILDQATVNTAYSNLNTAKGNIVALGLADYKALNAAIEAYGELTESWYTPGTWETVYTAYQAAIKVPTDLKDTTANNNTITQAATALTEAIGALQEADANYTTLQNNYNTYSAYKSADYQSGWSDFASALSNAKTVIDAKYKAKNQNLVDQANTTLVNAANALVAYGAASYTALDVAIADVPEYASYGETYYNNWEAYATALANAQNVNRNLNASQQTTVIDPLTTALTTAKANLTLKDADYDIVNNALANIPDNMSTYYTDDTVKAVTDAVAAVVEGKKINEQNTVNGYASAITTAIGKLELKKADVKALGEAITEAGNYDSQYFTGDSYGTLTTALNDAQALYDNRDNLTYRDNQEEVNEATENLNNAIKGLVSLGADYSALKTQIDAFEALTQKYYTDKSYNEAAEVYAVACTKYATLGTANQYTKEQQDALNIYATNLENAIKALVKKDASYTSLDAAIDAANTALSAVNNWQYTTDYINKVSAKLSLANNVARDLKIDEQDTIDKATEALNDALDAVEYSKYDYTTLDNLKTTYLSKEAQKDTYTKASWDLVEAAYNNLNWNYTNSPTDYPAAKLQDSNFSTILGSLVTAGIANYSKVEDAKTAAAKLVQSDYTVASWTTLQLALNAADAKTGLNENHQTEVDQLATDINNAIDALVKLASFTDLNDKIAEVENWLSTATKTNYTDDSLGAVNSTLATAKGLSRTLTADDQQTVNTALDNLTSAFNGLTLKTADFQALQALINEFKADDESKYTAVTWQAYVAAIDAGKNAIAQKLDITKQNDVNTLAQNITNTKTALTEKASSGEGVYEAPTGKVKDLSDPSNFEFTFRINKKPLKVQFVDTNGNTWTYQSGSEKVSVVAYDDTGATVSEYAMNLAYEDWTINQWLPAGTYTIRVKYVDIETNTQYWDANTKTMTVAAEEPTSIDIFSITPAATTGTLAKIPVTVVTGTDVKAVQAVMSDGTTITTGAFTTADGKNTFVVNALMKNWGENTVTIKVLYANKWHDAGTVTYTAVK